MEGVQNKELLDREVMSNVFFNMRLGRELWANIDPMVDKKDYLFDTLVDEIKEDDEENEIESSWKKESHKFESEKQERSIKKIIKSRGDGFKKDIQRDLAQFLK